jgi:hypothetical protein
MSSYEVKQGKADSLLEIKKVFPQTDNLRARCFTLDPGEGKTKIMTLQTDFRLFKNLYEPGWESKNGSRESIERMSEYYGRDDDGWTGGSFEELFSDKDPREFEKASKEVAEWPALRKLTHKMGKSLKRSRVTCEHDGEYSHDRRWDIKPFHRAVRAPKDIKTLDIVVGMQFSAMVKHSTITKYGATCVAIIKKLESLGISVGLSFMCQSQGFGYLPNGGSCDFNLQVRVKEYQDYIPTQQLLKVFNSNFYRRAVFASKAFLAHQQGGRHNSSLGRPKEMGCNVEASPGVLRIHNVKGIDDQHEVCRHLAEALNVERLV